MSSLQLSRRLLIVVALVSLILTGCPGPTFIVQQYGGPQRSPETIATLRVNGSEPARLLILDDQDVAAPIVEDGRLHIEILPGLHTVVVANASAPHQRYAPITFQAAAGKVYRVTFSGGPAGEAHVFEVDRQKDALVRDVTRVESSEPVPATRAPVDAPKVDDAGAPTPETSRAEDAG